MDKQIVLPVLGAGGWVSDPSKTLSQLFTHALVASNSQALIYSGNITSLPDIESTYQTSPQQLCDALETGLTEYFSRYFPSSVVTCKYTDVGYVKYAVSISITVTDSNGQSHDLAITHNYDNGTLADTIKLANGQTNFTDY